MWDSGAFYNKDCVKMIQCAYEQGYWVSLKGATETDYEILRQMKLDILLLQIPDRKGNSKFSLSKGYMTLLKKCNTEIPISQYSCHETVYEAVKPYLDPLV